MPVRERRVRTLLITCSVREIDRAGRMWGRGCLCAGFQGAWEQLAPPAPAVRAVTPQRHGSPGRPLPRPLTLLPAWARNRHPRGESRRSPRFGGNWDRKANAARGGRRDTRGTQGSAAPGGAGPHRAPRCSWLRGLESVLLPAPGGQESLLVRTGRASGPRL